MRRLLYRMKPEPPAVNPKLFSSASQRLVQHNGTPGEYRQLAAAVEQTPGPTELEIRTVTWNEHSSADCCSYRFSRVRLRRLRTTSARMRRGLENGGIVDGGDHRGRSLTLESRDQPFFMRSPRST